MAKTDYGFVGSGTGHISIKDTLGRWRGFTKIGNMEMFELTPESEELTRISKELTRISKELTRISNQVGSDGQALDTRCLPQSRPQRTRGDINQAS